MELVTVMILLAYFLLTCNLSLLGRVSFQFGPRKETDSLSDMAKSELTLPTLQQL